jgi:hypothetical protein
LRADLPKSSIVIQNSFDYKSMSVLFNKADKKKKKQKGSFPKALQCSRNQAEQLCTAADKQEKWVRLGNIGE